jgi:glycosyltransferase involved in cell wall biosynthesis
MNPTSNVHGQAAVLIVAFHFPPQAGSSGQLRALKFCRYLPEFGWRPSVLTLNPRAYEAIDPGAEKAIPSGVPVYRGFALDTKRHLGFRGSYLDLMALPDRWVSWMLGAIPKGLAAIRKERVDVVFTTFPIASSILAGLMLHKLTGKPWVVDLRDSMTEEGYPREPRTRRVWLWLERQAMGHASRVIFTAASTRTMYLKRYPQLSPERCVLISNGYDEEDFASFDLRKPEPKNKLGPIKLLHTGFLYPEERDPRPFFRALARLKNEGRLSGEEVNITFRAPGSEELYRVLLQENGISDLIQLLPHVPYRQALEECVAADGLLIFQAANCDHQIPAKAYEYLRLRKPVLALTTQTGDTAALLNEIGGATILELADEENIYRGLPLFLEALRSATHPLPDVQKIQRYARRNQAEQLAQSLWEIKNRAAEPASDNAESFAR